MHNIDSGTKAERNKHCTHPVTGSFLTYSWFLPADVLFLFGKNCHPGSSHTFLTVQLNSRKASFTRTPKGTYTDMASPVGH